MKEQLHSSGSHSVFESWDYSVVAAPPPNRRLVVYWIPMRKMQDIMKKKQYKLILKVLWATAERDKERAKTIEESLAKNKQKLRMERSFSQEAVRMKKKGKGNLWKTLLTANKLEKFISKFEDEEYDDIRLWVPNEAEAENDTLAVVRQDSILSRMGLTARDIRRFHKCIDQAKKELKKAP